MQGWDLYDTYQAQFTLTKTFANIIGASQMVIVGEAGVTHVPDLPDKLTGGPNGRGLRFNGPATTTSAATSNCAAVTARRCPPRTAWR